MPSNIFLKMFTINPTKFQSGEKDKKKPKEWAGWIRDFCPIINITGHAPYLGNCPFVWNPEWSIIPQLPLHYQMISELLPFESSIYAISPISM